MHIFGLCNQLGILIAGINQALKKNLKKLSVGPFNADLFVPRPIKVTEIFDFSNFKIEFDFLDTFGHNTDFKMYFDFDDNLLSKLKFSQFIQTSANKMLDDFGPCSAIIHSKLEKDTFALREEGLKRKEYEDDIIQQYEKVMNVLGNEPCALLTHDRHKFWDKYPNVKRPLRISTEREIAAAMDMCFAINALKKNPNATWIACAGSTFDFSMGKIEKISNKTVLINL
jgi:hypothetical protein